MIVTLSTCMSKAVNLGKCTWQWRSIGSSPKTWSLWRPRLQWESTVASGNQRWQWRILVEKTSFFGTFPSHVWLPKVRGNVWQMTLLRRRTWFSKPKLAYIDTSLWHAHTTCTYTNICPYVSIYIYISYVLYDTFDDTRGYPYVSILKAMDVTAVNAGTFTPRRAAKYLDVPLDVEEAPGETWPTRTWRQVHMISRLDW